MSKTHSPYAPEYRRQMVELVRAGRTPGELAREFQDDGEYRVHYVRQPFQREPDFGANSVNYDFAELLARAKAPS